MDASSDSPTTSAPQVSRTYGHIDGVPVGTEFKSREALVKAGVHGLLRAGIHGDPTENGGAFSICISGGYEDDEDGGETITYVGSGGRDPNSESGKQIKDQSCDDPGNKSLFISYETKRGVRVIRGADENNNWAPRSGYRYDGLYVVDLTQYKPGKRGFKMCFFKLRRIKEHVDDYSLPYRSLIKEAASAKMHRYAHSK